MPGGCALQVVPQQRPACRAAASLQEAQHLILAPPPPHPTPHPTPPSAAENPGGFCLAGTNKPGYSSIFVMPASLFTATIFSEAMWQRAWAASDKRCAGGRSGLPVGGVEQGARGRLLLWPGKVATAGPGG